MFFRGKFDVQKMVTMFMLMIISKSNLLGEIIRDTIILEGYTCAYRVLQGTKAGASGGKRGGGAPKASPCIFLCSLCF